MQFNKSPGCLTVSFSSKWLTVCSLCRWKMVSNFTSETWEHLGQNVIETVVLQRKNGMSPREVCLSRSVSPSVSLSLCLSVYTSAGLLGFHFMACWWSRRRYGFTRLGRARPRCWQQVLFDVDVPCWVSTLASTYDLNYDQRRNGMLVDDWWLWADRSGRGVEEEMEGGQQMESGVEGGISVEMGRQMDQVDGARREDEMGECLKEPNTN